LIAGGFCQDSIGPVNNPVATVAVLDDTTELGFIICDTEEREVETTFVAVVNITFAPPLE
jgi:hypothetical protein